MIAVTSPLLVGLLAVGIPLGGLALLAGLFRWEDRRHSRRCVAQFVAYAECLDRQSARRRRIGDLADAMRASVTPDEVEAP